MKRKRKKRNKEIFALTFRLADWKRNWTIVEESRGDECLTVWLCRSTNWTAGRLVWTDANAAAASWEDFSSDSRMPLSASSSRSHVTNPFRSGMTGARRGDDEDEEDAAAVEWWSALVGRLFKRSCSDAWRCTSARQWRRMKANDDLREGLEDFVSSLPTVSHPICEPKRNKSPA